MDQESMREQADAATLESNELVEIISPLFDGQDPEVVGAVVGQLLATLIAGHHPLMREPALTLVIDMVRELIPIQIEMMIEAGHAGSEWREATKQ